MGRLAKAGRMSGGVFFTATKKATLDVPIKSLTTADTLRVPLRPSVQRSCGAAEPDMELIAETGRHVDAGELIARPSADVPNGARLFAPTSGVIGKRTTVETAFGTAVPAVEVIPDGHQVDTGTPTTDPAGHPSEDLIDRLATLGIGIHPRQAPASRPAWIIIDGLESVPYATARTQSLTEHAEELIATACALGKALGSNEIHLVVDRRLKPLVRRLRRKARHTPVRILPLPNIYPQCQPGLLYSAVTGRSLPADRTPRDEGAWIIGTCELLDVHRTLTECQPPVTQTLTVAGDAVQRPGNYRVPIGMSVAAILQRVGLRHPPDRVVMGNALTGVAVRSAAAVIQRGVEGLYAWTPSATQPQDPTGCLRCGFCIEVCPVDIDPVGVFNTVELGRLDRVSRWAPWVCIACGLCDYVCPAALPLMQGITLARMYSPEAGPVESPMPDCGGGHAA